MEFDSRKPLGTLGFTPGPGEVFPEVLPGRGFPGFTVTVVAARGHLHVILHFKMGYDQFSIS